jgi:hypothetical protein
VPVAPPEAGPPGPGQAWPDRPADAAEAGSRGSRARPCAALADQALAEGGASRRDRTPGRGSSAVHVSSVSAVPRRFPVGDSASVPLQSRFSPASTRSDPGHFTGVTGSPHIGHCTSSTGLGSVPWWPQKSQTYAGARPALAAVVLISEQLIPPPRAMLGARTPTAAHHLGQPPGRCLDTSSRHRRPLPHPSSAHPTTPSRPSCARAGTPVSCSTRVRSSVVVNG